MKHGRIKTILKQGSILLIFLFLSCSQWDSHSEAVKVVIQGVTPGAGNLYIICNNDEKMQAVTSTVMSFNFDVEFKDSSDSDALSSVLSCEEEEDAVKERTNVDDNAESTATVNVTVFLDANFDGVVSAGDRYGNYTYELSDKTSNSIILFMPSVPLQ